MLGESLPFIGARLFCFFANSLGRFTAGRAARRRDPQGSRGSGGPDQPAL